MTQVVFCSGTWWGDCHLYDSIISVLLCHLMGWLCFICLTYCSVVVPDGVTVRYWFNWFYDMHVINNPSFRQKINLKIKWMWGTNLVPKFVCNLVPRAFPEKKGKALGLIACSRRSDCVNDAEKVWAGEKNSLTFSLFFPLSHFALHSAI